jgi:SAM-dependent methyltransferase
MKIMYAWLRSNLPPVDRWRILDIGAGYGHWLSMFPASNDVLGIDSSQQAVDRAKQWFGIDILNLDFLEADLEKDSFDLITGLAVIEHFLDPLEALVVFNGLLKKGGFLYLHTPDIFGLVLRSGISKCFKIVHTFYFSLETLSSLLLKAGFKVKAAKRTLPLIETSNPWNCGNFFDGKLDILVQKEQDCDLDTARKQPHAGNEVESVFSCYQRALKRDWLCHWISTFSRNKVLEYPAALFLRLTSRLGRLIYGSTPSKYEVVAKRCGSDIE